MTHRSCAQFVKGDRVFGQLDTFNPAKREGTYAQQVGCSQALARLAPACMY